MSILRPVAPTSRCSRVLGRPGFRALWLIGALALTVPTHEAVAAQATRELTENASEQARRAAEIYKTTMSPFCPGRTVDACPSPYAGEWREDIRRWVAEGVPTDEIRRRLKARTDQDLTGAPSTAMDGVLPFAVTALALILLALLLRVLIKPKPSKDATPAKPGANKTDATAAEADVDLDARLKNELDALDD